VIPINSLIKNMTDIEELRAKIQNVLDTCRNHSLSEDTIIYIKDTLGIFVSKKLAKAREEGVHLGVNNFETWMKQYHEDEDFVGSFGNWIDKLLTSTQEKD